MTGYLSQQVKIDRVANAAAAAQTGVDTSVLDMTGYDGVLFLASLGDVSDTSVLTLTVKENTANSTSSPTPTTITNGTASAVAGPFTAGASDYDNKDIAVDVYRPTKRYVFATLTRTTANAVVNGIYAIRYRGRELPIDNASLKALVQVAVN
jgi:hypothetical protein